MIKIAIDVGHARLTGARGNGYEEHDLCSQIAPLLKSQLERYGFQADIIDFPALPNKADLVETVKAINSGNYAFSVSLHCDAADNADAHGAHVCYVSPAGNRLAEAIARHLCPLMPGRANRTVKRTGLYVLNNTICTAVLIECGFITHAGDCRILAEAPDTLAAAIAAGIKDYLP